ncbi:MAG: peptidyl-prolyl cis-trans isomerase [Ignavibacteria bacterium]|jgi:hypothetical protein|nr:peptidyl-prolyl cis-trans isomerase [Ignavibacteria bacterium]MCU7503374.1 peptidyl-prolyl cis-trans isomerase [Ignavibacteria bacterium]MCU7518134.1 peptidyl-prolyl cis-trans isomerase [Ignavibacteria bacterium]
MKLINLKNFKAGLVLATLLPATVYVLPARAQTDFKRLELKEKDYKSLVVANVGNMKITAQEFMTSYEFGPAFVRREKNSLRRYLDFMINEKLLAFEGYSRGLDSTLEVSAILSDIEGDLVTEELYRKNIWDKLSVSNLEIEKGIEKERVKLQLRWIYKTSFDGIKEVYDSLRRGTSFDTLFNAQFGNGLKFEERYLESTAFSLGKKNPLLAAIVDTMAPGGLTPPVQTPDGYYILKLENIWRSVITTETEMEKLRYEVNRALIKEKADSLSDKFVNNVLLREKPVIIRETLNILKAYLAKKILGEEKYNEWDVAKNIRPVYPGFNPEVMAPYEKNTLIEKKSGNVKLEDFLRWYKTREPYITLEKSSHQAFFLSLQGVVWRMLRDVLLTRLAFSQGLGKKEEVRLQKKWWMDKLVYSKMKLEIASSIKIKEAEMKAFYNEYAHRYKDEKGNLKPFDEVKDEVRNDLYSYEYVKKVVGKIMGLKEKIPVKINEDLLNRLPVSDKEDPGAIDVYSVKNGGTFLRQAYPVIDYEWQFWN